MNWVKQFLMNPNFWNILLGKGRFPWPQPDPWQSRTWPPYTPMPRRPGDPHSPWIMDL